MMQTELILLSIVLLLMFTQLALVAIGLYRLRRGIGEAEQINASIMSARQIGGFEEHLEEWRGLLKQAKNIVQEDRVDQELSKIDQQTHEMSERLSTNDSSPDEIERLKQQIDLLRAKSLFLAALQDMKAGSPVE